MWWMWWMNPFQKRSISTRFAGQPTLALCRLPTFFNLRDKTPKDWKVRFGKCGQQKCHWHLKCTVATWHCYIHVNMYALSNTFCQRCCATLFQLVVFLNVSLLFVFLCFAHRCNISHFRPFSEARNFSTKVSFTCSGGGGPIWNCWTMILLFGSEL